MSYTRHLLSTSGTTTVSGANSSVDGSKKDSTFRSVPQAKPGAEGQVLQGNIRDGISYVLEPSKQTKFHWLDEKHLLNRDVEAQRGEPTHSLDTYLASLSTVTSVRTWWHYQCLPRKKASRLMGAKMAPPHRLVFIQFCCHIIGSSAEIFYYGQCVNPHR
jgi:hypothetical protein